MLRRRVVDETRRPAIGAVGADAARVVGRVESEVFVAARAQYPVVFERVENVGDTGLMSQIVFDERYLIVVFADGKFLC